MSYIGTQRSMWPRVTSRYAHDIVQAAYEALPIAEPTRSEFDAPVWDAHRARVRSKLASSQLAQLLPAGMDLLPDFYAALPEWYRPIAVLQRPRSYRDLVRHIVAHLDWYLDRSQPVSFNHGALAAALLVVGLLGALLVHAGLWLFCLPLLLVAFVLVLSLAQPTGSAFHDVNAQEFYEYIKRAYSDPPELGDELLARELETMVEHMTDNPLLEALTPAE